ncbi:MAG: 50S ribosomal protein L20 [Bacteroidales bacterium]|nr:50S ribosomal protein L20 [Bacteroidales bacterium]
MPRSVNSVASRARRKRILKETRGNFLARKNVWTVAKNTYEKGLGYAYRDRKQKKGNFRSLWIMRINAAARQYGLSYSKFIGLLAKQNVGLNRKVLADLALNNPAAFEALINSVKPQ